MIRNQQKLAEILSKLERIEPTNHDLRSFFEPYQKVEPACNGNIVWDKDFVKEFQKIYMGGNDSASPTYSPTTTNEDSSTTCTSSSALSPSKRITGSVETEITTNYSGADYTEDPLFLSLRDKMVRCIPEFSGEEQDLLIRLPTCDFEELVKLSCKTCSSGFGEKLVYVVCTGYDASRRQKLVLILRHLILPMIVSGAPVRNFLNTFKLVTSTDPSVPPEHIYLPMIQNKVVIPRPALKDVDKQSLLRYCVGWMVSEKLEFTQHTIPVYKFLLDDETKLEEQVLDDLLELLKRSLHSTADNVDLSALLALFVRNNAWQLKKSALQELLSLNGLNKCNNKTALDKCITERLSLL